MFDSYDVLVALKKLHLLDKSPPYWWPGAGSFEVIVGAILTQNTKWENVEKSLQSLKNAGILENTPQTYKARYKILAQNLADDEKNLQNIANLHQDVLASHIVSSGFFNQKSARLILLCQNILKDFGSFENFICEVSREWLLSQKGIGKESADSILNYACGRDVMVVDKYTYKFLCAMGIEIPDYDELQAWFQKGIEENLQNVFKLYGEKLPLACIYARFHGKIVESSKKKITLELPK
ncbi:3-methyladenine DNA glycosylase [Helicobacter sp. 11S02596-1]|uniref:3-methyladenine DNA glycosylase n=1 Tax=Helicobacter sp. 11S02596-1 TaxID=1476194 RepID=UPI000BA66BB2|nr:3-methyladenine DNA glycosylase [Helicobacter sp. 11S02596-1]PAF43222.1 3-methyladenine DNA glycosylase [Helicobacter sp. 11S02596-1]